MEELINFVPQHYEWFFSGLGTYFVEILISLGCFCLFGFWLTRRQSSGHKTTQSDVRAGRDINQHIHVVEKSGGNKILIAGLIFLLLIAAGVGVFLSEAVNFATGDNNSQVIGDVTINARDEQDKRIIAALLSKGESDGQQLNELRQRYKELLQDLRRLQGNDEVEAALALLEKGDVKKAEELFQAVLESKKKAGRQFLKEAATAARHIGALAYLHDTQKSLAAYKEATQLDPSNASGWNQLGKLLHRVGDLDGAKKSYLVVMEIGQKTNQRGIIATAYGNLGNVYRTRGDLDKAVEMYNKSLKINQALGRKEGMASDYGNLGIVYRTRGDLDKAVEMYNKSLKIEQALGRKEGMASNYTNLGIVYRTRGDLDKAVEMYNKSLKINQALGRKEGMANDYGNLGNVYQTRGDLDKAVEMYNKSLKINQALGRKEGMANAYGNLGNVYQTRGDLDKAVEMYNKSLKINQALGRKEGMAINYGNLGNVYQTRGDLDKAVEMYNKSLKIEQALGRKEGMASDYGNLGNVYQTRGDLDKAVEMYNKSLTFFEEIGATSKVVHVKRLLKRVHATQQEEKK